MDFIFGNSTALLEHCHIHCKAAGFITAQSRKSSQETTGYVFLRCVIDPFFSSQSFKMFRLLEFVLLWSILFQSGMIISHGRSLAWCIKLIFFFFLVVLWEFHICFSFLFVMVAWYWCRCIITGNGGNSYAHLGRPWGPFGRVVFAYTYIDGCIKHVGWNNWGKAENERSACFYEYRYTISSFICMFLS